MAKALYISEKPSVAREFAKALNMDFKNQDGYMEAPQAVVTWCVGHLVTMSYPEVYDQKYKKWSLATLPFLPEKFKYEVISGVKKQYKIVAGLLNRRDVERIYVCTDSGREGEYIYRLVERQANVKGKERRRVWIDSQTEEEILRGIREAKDLSEYDNLCESAYLRAKEDYLMGINFSRLLSLKYGNAISNFLGTKYTVISVGRVMTCVQGMVVRREREIREFVKTPFYRVLSTLDIHKNPVEGEWRAMEGSAYFQSPKLYKDNGFKEKKDAQKLIEDLTNEKLPEEWKAVVDSIEKKKETKNPPLLYNLAELQNDCSRLFKISPDQTLQIAQELYEKKLVTYPRTDARVLSSAVAKEIHKNIGGLRGFGPGAGFAAEILNNGSYKGIAKTRYVNDKQITDHYAIIPTGQGLNNLNSLPPLSAKVYEVIVRRFLSIFYPPAVYQKFALCIRVKEERFFANFKVLIEEGYLKVAVKKDNGGATADREAGASPAGEDGSGNAKKTADGAGTGKENGTDSGKGGGNTENNETELRGDEAFIKLLNALKKGDKLAVDSYEVKEGETSPPKRYTSGSIILTMENAGQFIEDEELRAQIKGSGIGTSATRAEILKKLVNIEYLALNKKTQVLTPTLMGEMIYDVVGSSIKALLDPALTASWEKGLTLVADGDITSGEYMDKLNGFVGRRTEYVKQLRNQGALFAQFQAAATNYQSAESAGRRQTKQQTKGR